MKHWEKKDPDIESTEKWMPEYLPPILKDYVQDWNSNIDKISLFLNAVRK